MYVLFKLLKILGKITFLKILKQLDSPAPGGML